VAMGQTMMNSMNAAQGGAAQAAAPAADDPVAKLEKLKAMLDKGLIAQADYDAAKAEVLRKMAG
jgi:membrane protease subunit (stomatin/prohibitin family)